MLKQSRFGGLVGVNSGGEISHSFAQVYIYSFSPRTGTFGDIVGGLVGRNEGGAKIKNSYATGAISGHCRLGGLVGEHISANRDSAENISTIENSYAQVDMNKILNVRCINEVFNVAGFVQGFGGLVGFMEQADIVDSYAAARQSGGVLGLIGRVRGTASATNSYWDNILNNKQSASTGVGETTAFGGQTTAVLQGTTPTMGIYANWSSDDWDFGTDAQYPTLKATDGSIAMQVLDSSLVRNVEVANVAIARINGITGGFRYSRNSNRYRLYVDATRLPLPITFTTTPPVAGLETMLYCDDALCPFVGSGDTLILDNSNTQEITLVASAGNRVSRYYFDIVRDNLRLDNIAAIDIAEGDMFTVGGDYAGSSDLSWSQISGTPVNIADADSLNLVLAPQVDLLPADVDHGDFEFELSLSITPNNRVRQVYLSRKIAVRINKVNNGRVTGNPVLSVNTNRRITVTENLNDIDGTVSNLSRQFQRRFPGDIWRNVNLSAGDTVDAGYQYRFIGLYSDGQGYTSEPIVSNIVTVGSSVAMDNADIDGDSIINADDIDDDGDGLIEIRHLEDLDAVRHQLDGSGSRASADADLITRGCPITGCIGYELTRNLNFTVAGSYRNADANMSRWTVSENEFVSTDDGWQPIGGVFDAIFNGNGYSIARLSISRSSAGTRANVGLFSEIGASGKVENLVLDFPAIKGLAGFKNVGAITGLLRRGGVIRNSDVFGTVTRNSSVRVIRTDLGSAGGLVGVNAGYIVNSRARINVSVQDSDGTIANNGNVTVGGLVGRNRSGGKIHNSYYSAGEVSGTCIAGGLVGSQLSAAERADGIGEIRNSYVHSNSDVEIPAAVSCATPYLGGLVGRHIDGRSIVANSYANGRAYVPTLFGANASVSDLGASQTQSFASCPGNITATYNGNPVNVTVAGLLNRDTPSRAPTNSYWRREPYRCAVTVSGTTYITHAVSMPDVNNRRSNNTLTNPSVPNTPQTCLSGEDGESEASRNRTRSCITYRGWNTDHWDFGTDMQYPLLRYTEGADRDDPACDFDDSTSLPMCGALLRGQPRTTVVSPRSAPPVSGEPPQLVITYARNDATAVALDVQSTITVNEGDTLILDATRSRAADNAVLDYRWRQTRGPELLPTSQNIERTLSVTVRDDLLAAEADSGQAVIKLEVVKRNNPDAFASRDIIIDVVKTNRDGDMAALRWVDGPLGVANANYIFASEINDADGGPFTDISYQWELDGSPTGLDRAYYRVGNIFASYRLTTTYTDNQGYSNTIVSVINGRLAFDDRIVDHDRDGLIDIFFIEQLDLIRNQLDGTLLEDLSNDEFPFRSSRGCPGDVCRGYELVRDLDFDDTLSYRTVNGPANYNNWDPIGTVVNIQNQLGNCSDASSNCFTAIFEGNGYTISNLRINQPVSFAGTSQAGQVNLGLFAAASGNAEIRGVRLVDVNIAGSNNVGALVGSFSGRSITDSHVLSGTVSTYYDGGCLIGRANGTNIQISDSSANCTLTGTNVLGGLVSFSNANIGNSRTSGAINLNINISGQRDIIANGGLVGVLESGGRIENGASSATVVRKGGSSITVTQGTGIGGLVGIGRSNTMITNSYATGDVRGEGSRAGGLVGNLGGEISNSYAAGDVDGSTFIGGLVGHAANATIGNSYAIGDVNGDNTVGGLIGDVNDTAIDNSHATGRISADDIVGGLIGRLIDDDVINRPDSKVIANNYTFAAVTARGGDSNFNQVGGFLGYFEVGRSTIVRDSYAAGSVVGAARKGGFIGIYRASGQIIDNYSIARVSGNPTNDRGFIRLDFGPNLTGNYWDIERSGQSAGSRFGSLRGFNSEVLKSSRSSNAHPYRNWSTERWDFGTTEQYPVLKYDDGTCAGGTPSVNCGAVLPRQRLGLQDLQIGQIGALAQPELSAMPRVATFKDDFDRAAVDELTVSVRDRSAEIRIVADAYNPAGVIKINDAPPSVGSANYFASSDFTTATRVRIVVSEPYEIGGKENLDVEYRIAFNTVPEASAIAVRAAMDERGEPLSTSVPIREGHFITLSSELSDADGDDLRYRWTIDDTQVRLLDRTMLAGRVSGGSGRATLSFYLRDDFIAADQTAETVNISLAVSDTVGETVTQAHSFSVAKYDNGTIDGITTPTRIGLTYTAAMLDKDKLAEDPDGAGDVGDIAYQWQRRAGGNWTDINAANGIGYTVVGEVADYYRVAVSYIDGQGYSRTVASPPQQASTGLVLRETPVADTEGFIYVELAADNLSPDFNFPFEERNYSVPTEVERLDVTAIGGAISVNGVPLADEIATTLDLEYGDNEITVVSQGEDDTSTRTYTVFRAYDVAIRGWRVEWQGEDGTEIRDLGADLRMRPDIPNAISTITVIASVNELVDIVIASDGNTVGEITTSTQAGLLVAQATIGGLALGENGIAFTVTAPGGSFEDPEVAMYSVTVWHRYNTRLRNLRLVGTDFTTKFRPEVPRYFATIANERGSETIEFERKEGTTVLVNDVEVDGNRVDSLPLNIGDNTIALRVQAPRETDTVYTLVVVREYSLDLQDLVLTYAQATTVTLVPTFASTRHIYTAVVPTETSQVRVTFATDLQVVSELSADIAPITTDTRVLADRIEKIVSVPLNYDDNTMVIGTSALGEQQATTLTITRLRSTDAELRDLQVLNDDDINVLSVFNPTTRSYTVEVANDQRTVSLRVTPQDTKITAILWNGIPLSLSGLETGSVTRDRPESEPLFVLGENEIELKIIAHDKITSQTYTLVVNRLSSKNARLRSILYTLSSSSGERDPQSLGVSDFVPDKLEYRLPGVESAIDCILVRALQDDQYGEATVEISKVAGAESDSPIECPDTSLRLGAGQNTIEVKVTASDRKTINRYRLNISRALSSDIRLSRAPLIIIPSVAITPAIAVPGSDTEYTAVIDRNVTRFSVSATAAHPAATVTISIGDGADAIGGRTATKTDIPIGVPMGLNDIAVAQREITITVTAQNGSTENYKLTARIILGSNANLASLRVSPVGSLIPQGDPPMYATTLGESVGDATVTAVAADQFATVTISENNTRLVSAKRQGMADITLADTGDRRDLLIRVIAENGAMVKDHTLTVARAQSTNDCLDAIAILDADDSRLLVNQDIECNNRSPSFDVANSVAQVLIRPTAENSQAVIAVHAPGDADGERVQSGADSTMPISIDEGGSAQVRIEVTSQNGATSRAYIVTINRAESSDADLRNLRLLDANDANLLPDFDPTSETQVYRFNVPNATTGTRVVAEAHPRAIIEVVIDGIAETATGTINRAFDLTVPEREKRIRITVSSQDDSMTRDYTIAVTRARADRSNANLASIALSLDDDTRTSLFTLTSPDEDASTTYSARITGITGLEVQNIIQIVVSPRAEDGEATVSIDGGAAESMPDKSVALNAALDKPEPAIPIKVIAEDRTTSAAYSLVITRESSADASLASVIVGRTTLPVGRDGTYTTSLGEHTANTTVTVTTTHSQATVAITLEGETNSTRNMLSRPVTIADTGTSRDLRIVVTAQDGRTMESYTLTVRRDPSRDASLRDITVVGASVIDNGDRTYTATVGEATTSSIVTVTAGNEFATVVITDASNTEIGSAEGAAQASITLDDPGDSKELRIRITAQSRSEDDSADYTLTVDRAPSTDARLSALELLPQSSVAVEPLVIFDSLSDGGEYRASFTDIVTGVRVKPTAQRYVNKVEVFAPGSDRGEVITESGQSSLIAVTEGETTTITIVVTAQDRRTTQDYVVLITLRNTDTELNGIVPAPGRLNPNFAGNVANYEIKGISGNNFVLGVNIQRGQRIEVRQRTLDNLGGRLLVPILGTNAYDITRAYGENTIEIVVTAEAGETTQRYTVTDIRPVILEDLRLTGLRTDDPYRFGSSTPNYTVTIANENKRLVVRPVLSDTDRNNNVIYTIRDGNTEIAAQDLELGAASIALVAGVPKVITVIVEAENGVTNSYTVRATREISRNADLSALRIMSGRNTLADFDNLATSVNHVYTIPNPIVGDKITSVSLRAQAAHPDATISLTIGEDTSPRVMGVNRINESISLAEGETKRARIVVTAQQRSVRKTYTVTIMRAASRDTRLSTLAVSSSELIPQFDFDASTATQEVRKYSVELPNDTEDVELSATAANANATLVIRDGMRNSGRAMQSASLTVPVNRGMSKDITISVTAQDRTATTYTVVISRAASVTQGALGFMLRMSDVALDPVSDSGTEYRGELISTATETVASAAAIAAGVSIRSIGVDNTDYILNDNPVDLSANAASVPISEAIPLQRGANRITLVVRRADSTEDGYTEQHYSVTVIRPLVLQALGLGGLSDDDPYRFDPFTRNYTVTVANERDNLVVSPTLFSGDNGIVAYTIFDAEDEVSQAANGSATIPLDVDKPKNITVALVAPGATTSNYVVRATREASDNANLRTLQVVSGENTLADFGNLATSANYVYTIPNPIVGIKTSIIRVRAMPAHSGATIIDFTIDGADADIRDAISFVDAEGEDKIVSFKVLAENGQTSKTYTVTIDRERNQDTRLRTLGVSPGLLAPAFVFNENSASQGTDYTIELPNDIAGTTLTATVNDANAELLIKDGELNSLGPSFRVEVDPGERKLLTVDVTAQNGNVQTYRVTLYRDSAVDRTALGFMLQMSGISLTEDLEDDSGTEYIGTLSGEDIVATTATASVDVNGVSIQSIRIGSDSTNYNILNGDLVANTTTSISRSIPLARGENRISIVLRRADNTADGFTKATYTVNILRPLILQSLGLTGLSMDDPYSFDASVRNYTVMVANGSENLVVSPVLPEGESGTLYTISVVGDPTISAENMSATIPFALIQTREIVVTLTAPGVATSTYTVRATRRASTNAGLRGILYTLSSTSGERENLSVSDFISDTLEYTLPDVENAINCISVNAVQNDQEATVEITKVAGTESDSPNECPDTSLRLGVGQNTIEVKVTASDRRTINRYRLNISRALSSDTRLSSAPIIIIPGVVETTATAVPVSNTEYTAVIGRNVTRFSVSATAAHSSATVTISIGDGADVVGGRTATKTDIPIGVPTSLADIAVARQEITITVTAQDGMTQDYKLTARIILGSNANLASLSVSPVGSLMPQGDPPMYTTTVGESVMRATVTAVAGDQFATVVISENNTRLVSAKGEVEADITFAETGDSRELLIRVTAENGEVVKDHTLTVTRVQSNNDCLDAIAILDADDNRSLVNEDIECNNRSPSFNVANSVAQVLIRPTAENARAVIDVHAPGDVAGERVQSGADSTMPISIAEGGSAQVRIEVTSQNGATSRTYIVTINRAESSDADLRNLRLLDENDANLLPDFDATSETQVYRFNVPNATTGTRVVAEAHPNARIEVVIDGIAEVATGTINREFDLTVPEIEKRIRITVRSQDDSTTRGYTVAVTRAEADRSNANLASIALSLDDDMRRLLTLTSPDEEGERTYSARIMGIAGREVQTITQIVVSPRAADLSAMVSIDGNMAESMPDKSVTLNAALDTPEPAIPIKVIAEDGTTSATYSLVITRVSSADASLASVIVGGDTITVGRDGIYRRSLDENTSNTTVTVTTTHSQATVAITLDGETDSARNMLGRQVTIADTGTSRTLIIVVTAQDSETIERYTLELSRDPSSDASLADITVVDASVVDNGDGTYNATLNQATTSSIVTVTAGDQFATVVITDASNTEVGRAEGAAQASITLDDPGDSTELRIRITAQSGSEDDSEDYTLTVDRTPSTDARLSALELLPQSSVAVDRLVIFDSLSDGGEYRASFTDSVTGVRVKPTAQPYVNKVEVFAPGRNRGEVITEGGQSSVIAVTEDRTTMITIVVTAQDRRTTQEYIVLITLRNTDAELNGIVPVPGRLSPSFAGDVDEYEIEGLSGNSFALGVNIRGEQRIEVRQRSADNLSGRLLTPTDPGTNAYNITRAYGENTIEIVVTAEDNETTQRYTVTDIRPLVLETLGLDGLGDDDPYRFAPSTTSYTVTVANENEHIVVRPVLSQIDRDNRVMYTIRDGNTEAAQDLESGEASIALVAGVQKVITVIVEAPNGVTNSYTVRATRERSRDTRLRTLGVSPGSLAPTFVFNEHSASQRTDYIVELPNDIASTTLTATVNAANAELLIRDGELSSPGPSLRVEIDPGARKSVTLDVTAQNGSTQTYTVTLYRDSAVDRTALRFMLQMSGITLTEDSEDNSGTEYIGTLSGGDIAATMATASVDVNGVSIQSIRIGGDSTNYTLTGNLVTLSANTTAPISRAIPLARGENRINILISRADNTADGVTEATYTVSIFRPLTLQSLDLTGLSDDDAYSFDASVRNYTVTVASDSENLVVSPALPEGESGTLYTISVVGDSRISAENMSATIPFALRQTREIVVTLTAPGVPASMYTVRATREVSNDADLRDLRLFDANGANLLSGFDPTSRTQVYRFEVPNATTGTRIVAEAHPRARIEVVIDSVEETAIGMIDRAFDLTVPEIEKLIRITVSSQDDSTTRGYTIAVTRAGADDSNANLASIALSLDDDTRTGLLTLRSPDEGTSATYTARITGIDGREVQTITQIVVSPRAADSAATVSIDGDAAESMPDKSVTLNAALDTPEPTIPIKVIAGNRITSATYSLVIIRESSDDTSLADIAVVGASVVDKGDGTYTATLDEHTSNTTVTVTTTHSQAAVAITLDEETNSARNMIGRPVTIADTGAFRTLRIVVTAQDGETTQGYALTISRDPSSNADLSALRIVSGEKILAEFGNFATSSNYVYTIPNPIVDDKITSVRLQAQAEHPDATISLTVDGDTETIGSDISLAEGETKIARIVVTAQQRSVQKTYTVTISRQANQDTRLSMLRTSQGTVPGFMFDMNSASQQNNYTVELPSDISNTTITATAFATSTTLVIGDGLSNLGPASRSASLAVSIEPGMSRDITIVITPQSGKSRTYTVTLLRTSATNIIERGAIRIRAKVFLEGPLQ